MSDLSIQTSGARATNPASRQIIDIARHHAWLLIYVAFYIVIAAVVLKAHELKIVFFDLGYFGTLFALPIAACVFWMLGHVIHHTFHVRPFSWQAVLRDIKTERIVTLERVAFVFFPILAISAFSSLFSSFKTGISSMHPFAYDVAFMELDRWLHFGQHPWEWIQPVFGTALATSVISFFYNLWFFVMYGVLLWQIFSLNDKVLRMRYLLSFIAIWSVLGSLTAVWLSSVGPVYYEHFVVGENPYAPLMTFLRESSESYPVWSLRAQDYLWGHYEAGTHGTGAGIAAMPSLHVGVVLLQALFRLESLGSFRKPFIGLCRDHRHRLHSSWLALCGGCLLGDFSDRFDLARGGVVIGHPCAFRPGGKQRRAGGCFTNRSRVINPVGFGVVRVAKHDRPVSARRITASARANCGNDRNEL